MYKINIRLDIKINLFYTDHPHYVTEKTLASLLNFNFALLYRDKKRTLKLKHHA
jgi:hypothetical protein